METRPPVVGIFGHIDHGKSTLLDYIRKTNVTEKEIGGITQHISAYEVMHKLKDGLESRITFLDTPGHEAFSSVRTRGANVADIAILVVSAEDGVKPQTLEVYKYIKESSLPYIVAITKIDKPSADIERAKQNLAENGIFVEGYGGDISVVPLSAKTGQGVDELLEMLTLTAGLLELKADPEELGSGIIIESRLDPKRGITAVGIIKNGTVRKGCFAASSEAIAPLRYLLDAGGNTVEELSFSSPVQIVGWDKLPRIGSEFKTFLKKEGAFAYAKTHDLGFKIKDSEIREIAEGAAILPIILKADTAGSLEAIENEIRKVSRERIVPKIVLSNVGAINENDVKSALSSTNAIILGFNTKVDNQAKALAERSSVPIELFDIIYELTDRVAVLLAEREPKIEVEEVTGSARVLKLFSSAKGKQVIGARVLSGTLSRGANLKIVRRETEIASGKIKELQQAKVATDSVGEWSEFGAMVESKIEIVPGDILEAFTLVTK
ncbi:MAG: translation initiation factor IF-2 [Candidatus Zambryskibacteria bacterium]|nr:translation initiation factor IF-2 [Candidatus Zambryskibacteria bacterium]